MELRFNRPDLHLHSCFSDGSDTPESLLAAVKNAGVDIFSMTDHDTMDGCAAMRSLLKEGDPFFINGVEFSCRDESGKYHILGYDYDETQSAIIDAVSLTHLARRQKMYHRFDYLEGLGYTFTEEEKRTVTTLENPGKPHFVALLMKKGYISSKAEGFELMGGYHGKAVYLTPEQAIFAILFAGGIPVLAHGILADGSKNLTEEETEARVLRLKAAGLLGLECFYSGYTPEQKAIMLKLAQKHELLITAGSDYHGQNKPIHVGDTNAPEEALMQPFYDILIKR